MTQNFFIPTSEIWEILESIPDPEIPVISIVDLGIVRKVEWLGDLLNIEITPTYSGCPAMHVMEVDIHTALKQKGIEDFIIKTIYHPAWTTDWMKEEAKEKLRKYGIAPPQGHTAQRIHTLLNPNENSIACPQCKSIDTKLVSEFGSTACKALYKCNNCLEPFDYFKCI